MQRRVAFGVFGIDVGAMFEQYLNPFCSVGCAWGAGKTLVGSQLKMQWSEAVRCIINGIVYPWIWVRFLAKEIFHFGQIMILRGPMQGRLSIVGLGIYVRTSFDQKPKHFRSLTSKFCSSDFNEWR